jgi:hypothetical protein
MKQDWILALVVTNVSYAGLFLYCVMRNVYREHVGLRAKAARDDADLQYLRTGHFGLDTPASKRGKTPSMSKTG